MAKRKDPASVIGQAMFAAIKPIYKEGERMRRQSSRARREVFYTRAPKWSQKEVVFEVLPRAIKNAGGLVSARDLFYATRPLVYGHRRWPEGKALKYDYFSQALLTESQEYQGPVEGLWRDPRGHLHEPHTGKILSLGTREVASYEFPELTFDKILYVEKEGELPKLQEARLAERYDMALLMGKGYPAEATRALFERAESGDYQLFVFHDADLDGYNIARVMREETRRMPGYSVDVVDIGLTVEDAVEMDLAPEPFHRKKDISDALYSSLSEVDREYLYNRNGYRRGISGERFELNAILPASRRIEYIERKLAENGVRGKVIPPEDDLKRRAEEMYRGKHAGWVDGLIADVLDGDGMKKALADSFIEAFALEEAEGYIKEAFEKDGSLPWRQALGDRLDSLQQDHEKDLKEALREKIGEAMKGGSE